MDGYGAIRITLWKNENLELGTFFDVGIHRRFERDGKWEKGSYFSELVFKKDPGYTF